MSTKPATMMTTPTLRLVVAEDLRREVDGKVTAVGLFADNIVVVQMPFDASPPTKESPILLKSLGFMFNISGLPAKKSGAKATVRIEIANDGQRQPFMAQQEMSWPDVGDSINILGVMSPCPISTFGDRKFFVSFGDIYLEANYEVRKKLLPAPATIDAKLPAVRPRTAGVVAKRRRVHAAD